MDEPTSPAPPPAAVPPVDPAADKAKDKERKKKEKARKEWFSFVGRIVAQVVGAVASVVLAIFFLQRSQSPPSTSTTSQLASAGDVARVTRRSGDDRITLAVLPLANYSGDPQQDYFAAGMTDAVIADLAQIEGLRVISRTSVMQYRTQPKSIPEIASELGVDLVVEGSVARSGDRVRVTAQLIDTATDEHLWARNYERTMRDVLALQGELVAEIAKEVKVAVTPIRRGWLIDRPPVDPVAYDLYLRGRVVWGLRGDEAMKAAVEYFQQAIDRQPTFALAYAGLADSYVLSATAAGGGAPDARVRALAAATRALELDPSLAEAHTSLAGIRFFHERNLAAAEREFLRALELNPGYPTAHQWYAILLSELGRDKEALTHAREAVARDPLSGTKHQSLGLVHYYGRRYDEAIASLRKALELSPQLPLPRALLAKALFQRRDYAEAVRVAESAPEPRSADLIAITGLAYQRLSNAARADEAFVQLQRRKPIPSVPLAYWYAVNGQRDAAFAALQRRGDPSVVPTAVSADPLFDNLRDDARFKALMQGGTL